MGRIKRYCTEYERYISDTPHGVIWNLILVFLAKNTINPKN